MDEIRRLEREIDEMQNRLRQQNEAAARERSRLIEQNRRELEKYRSEMQRSLEQHDRDARYEYETMLAKYRHDLNDKVNSQLSEVNADYGRLLDEIKQTEAELLKKNKELSDAIAELKSCQENRDNGNSREAAECQAEAVEVYRNVEKMPHEKFTPGRLRIFYDSIRDSQRLQKAGLFEAAAAVAISARTGLKRLGFTIDDKQSEWEGQYELFKANLELLETSFKVCISDWRELTGEALDDEVCRIELDFWSRGEFGKIYDSVKNYRCVIDKINSAGHAAYLRSPDGVSLEQLKEYTDDLHRMIALIDTSGTAAKNRCTAACERADMGEAVIDFLQDEINLTLHGELTGFQSAADEVSRSEIFQSFVKAHFDSFNISEDMREWLRLVFENASGDMIYIYIVPIEAHGSVLNHIVLHIDYRDSEQPQYSRDIYVHICEALNYADDDLDRINNISDVNELKFSPERSLRRTGEDIEMIRNS